MWREQRLRVFENRVLRRIFASKTEEVAGGWNRLHDEFHYLCCSPYIIGVIRSRRMRWVAYVARKENIKN
jgi:hypothetical protein